MTMILLTMPKKIKNEWGSGHFKKEIVIVKESAHKHTIISRGCWVQCAHTPWYDA